MKKHSYKRDAILACLQNTKTHPTAEWIYQQLKPEIPDLSLGTVYRNLAAFRKEGAVVSVGCIKGNERYDAVTAPHAHFACQCCGSVVDVEDVELPLPPLEYGVVSNYSLLYSGVCKRCAEK